MAYSAIGRGNDMTLAERDAYVIAQLATFTAQGMSMRQAVNEVIRTSGTDFISVPPSASEATTLDADVTNVQSAVAAVPSILSSVPLTKTQQRAVNSGKVKLKGT